MARIELYVTIEHSVARGDYDIYDYEDVLYNVINEDDIPTDEILNYWAGLQADEIASELEDEDYYQFMYEELRWYNYARQHGMA